MVAEILDRRFRCVFLSGEAAKMIGLSGEEAEGLLGKSVVGRQFEPAYAETIRLTDASGTAWWEHNAPIMRHYLRPATPGFDEVFGTMAEAAAGIDPVDRPPRAWYDRVAMREDLRFRRTILGDQHQVQIRLSDDAGAFLGVLYLYGAAVPASLQMRLGRGDPELYKRMDRVSEPDRRAAAILFADLEASGALSRRLSSASYFRLIRSLTDLIDTSVTAEGGIVGKHAGDGGSALFVALDFDRSESAAARAAIAAARAIRAGSAQLGAEGPLPVKVGLHWGATLMIGQVATTGRLEVTALGDQMNEAARIEAAAGGDEILASKELIERLAEGDADEAGVDPETIAYVPLAQLAGADEKVVRDAGSLAVARI